MNETGMAAAPAEAAWRIWQAPRQQTAFRQLMTAFSYPGRVVPLPMALNRRSCWC